VSGPPVEGASPETASGDPGDGPSGRPAGPSAGAADRAVLADPGEAGRSPGWREVLLVSAAVVVVVLGAAVLTGILPTSAQRVVFHEPLLIGILIIGTVVVLWGVARRPE
jgi:hypothetical protein